ncbi:hypothetical protein JJC00_06600 [Bradyrhizobium diazoefficiens]|uniref:hypothetical protein n=1 Tax=Bradyrhizobium diazoefficiens TaxID=1355477 RepID=UPI00190E0CEE|nr:hypothetical protein [Bradyrhizobium diazoefficiens]QQO35348.1 hypothetical protein JJC00_06600 [Bradyrhizobium diazoefficiens]
MRKKQPMSGYSMAQWFANRGQVMQTVSAVCSAICAVVGVLIALYINLPGVFQTSIDSANIILSILAIPALLVGGSNAAFYLMAPIMDRMAQRSFEKRFPEFRTPAPQLNAAENIKPGLEERKERPPIDFEAALPPKAESEVLDVKIKVGSYWETSGGLDRFRISIIGIQGDPGKLIVELSVTTGGSVFHPGTSVKEVGVNRFLVPESHSGFQSEDRCVFQFSFSDNHIHFRAARVDGLDLHNQEVAVNVAKFRTMTVPTL